MWNENSFWTFGLLVSIPYWPWSVGMNNGFELNAYGFTWLAGLLTEDWQPRCSGSVITVHFVVTAASCIMFRVDDSFDIINPSEYIVVVPSRNITIRRVDTVVPHPNLSCDYFYTIGLIGVKVPFQLDKNHVSLIPIWPGDKEELSEQFSYIFENFGYMSCSVVTWNNNGGFNSARGLQTSDHLIHHVSYVNVEVVHPDVCIPDLCAKAKNFSLCVEKFDPTLCVRIVEPTDAEFCAADRGAALICQDFLWGVFIGGASCTNHDVRYPVFVRIDVVVDFIMENLSMYPHRHVSAATLLHCSSILVGLQYIIIWMQHYSVIFLG